jgi:lipooligosaccharide transport system permease protein
MTTLRLTPALSLGLGSRRSARLVERNIYVYRHQWMMLLSGFFEPLFYLVGIGFGLGALVGTVPGPDGQPIPYQLFVAPALLATSAMNGAIAESTFNFFFKLNYSKTFAAILSTPLSPGDIAGRRARLGAHPAAALRDRVHGVMLVLGLFVSPWVILAVPGAMPRRAGVRGRRHGRDDVHEDVAGLRPHPARDPAAVPVLGHVLPDRRVPARAPAVIVRLTPLYQGVDLLRSLDGRGDLADPPRPRRVPGDHGDRRIGVASRRIDLLPAQVVRPASGCDRRSG